MNFTPTPYCRRRLPIRGFTLIELMAGHDRRVLAVIAVQGAAAMVRERRLGLGQPRKYRAAVHGWASPVLGRSSQ